ncbi:hypothetical protein FHT21_004203 [Pedobacter sp. SG908]|nr:hypothetical protein [Pedobacter sp. SG908]NMN37990.1 hypothetical protein [Pedobacter sp. SG918]
MDGNISPVSEFVHIFEQPDQFNHSSIESSFSNRMGI